MEEFGNDITHGLSVVDESLKHLGRATRRNDIVIRHHSRYQARGSLRKHNTFLCGPQTHLTVALQIHHDDKGVVLQHVAMERSRGLNHLDTKIGRVQDLMRHIAVVTMCRFVLRIDRIVKGLGGQVGMELAGLAIHAGAVVVVDPVGDVGGLLDFGQQNATTDGMDSACREIKHIAGFDLMVGQHFCNAAVFYTLLVFIGRDALLKAGIEMGTWIGLDDIPHLGLAILPCSRWAISSLGCT